MADNEHDSSSPGFSASSSDQAPSSQDALDTASVRELSRNLHGLRQRLDHAIEGLHALRQGADFREGVMRRTVDQHIEEKKISREEWVKLRADIKNALKLTNAIAAELAKKIGKEISQEIKTHAPEEDAVVATRYVRGQLGKALGALLAKYAVALIIAAAVALGGALWALVRRAMH